MTVEPVYYDRVVKHFSSLGQRIMFLAYSKMTNYGIWPVLKYSLICSQFTTGFHIILNFLLQHLVSHTIFTWKTYILR
jgi:hypothetical protein